MKTFIIWKHLSVKYLLSGFSDNDANARDVSATGTSYGIDVSWTVSPTSCDVIGYRITYYPTGQPTDNSWGKLTKSVVIYMYTALGWQKKATLENDISRKWIKCVCHVHWHQCHHYALTWISFSMIGFCSKLRLEVECAKSTLKTWFSQIWWFVTCFLLSE